MVSRWKTGPKEVEGGRWLVVGFPTAANDQNADQPGFLMSVSHSIARMYRRASWTK